jgi:hypothetical protein
MSVRIFIFIIFQFLIFSSSNAQNKKHDNFFEVGLGIVSSSQYKDVLVDAYPSISGFLEWIDIEFGFGIQLSRNIYLIPKARLLASRIEIQAFSGFPASQKANIVFLPGAALRYNFGSKRNAFYLDGFLNAVFPYSDLSRIEFESDGIAFGAELGMVFKDEYELGVGFIRVPVRAFSGRVRASNANFGGIGFVLRRRI